MRHGRAPAPARHRTGAPQEGSLSPFVGAFPRADAALHPALPEVAFIGRSNVGKSSLLNALVGARVARVSRTPGKTRLLHVYRVEAPCYLLDLPGYGYARASQADRAAYRRLVAGTLTRPALAGAVWLLDLRREPSVEDRAMQDLLAAGGTRVLAALTKSDKLPRGRRLDRAVALREALRLDPDQVITTSARTREGVDALRAAVAALVGAGAG